MCSYEKHVCVYERDILYKRYVFCPQMMTFIHNLTLITMKSVYKNRATNRRMQEVSTILVAHIWRKKNEHWSLPKSQEERLMFVKLALVFFTQKKGNETDFFSTYCFN